MPSIHVDDFDMVYEEAGSGPPLVLLHGLGASLEDWEFQVPEFSKTHRVITPDLRGFGRSGRGRRAFSIAQLAQDVSELLRLLGVGDYFLLGYSMGGAVAQQIALEHPQGLRKLVITNSMPTFRPRTLRQRFEVWYRQIVMGLLGPVRLARLGAERMFPGEPELQEKSIRRGSEYNTRATYLDALAALTKWSVIERLHELKMPVLVLAAEQDYFSREDSVLFAHALPRGRLRVFRNTHHGMPMEIPAAFNRAVLKFLSQP